MNDITIKTNIVKELVKLKDAIIEDFKTKEIDLTVRTELASLIPQVLLQNLILWYLQKKEYLPSFSLFTPINKVIPHISQDVSYHMILLNFLRYVSGNERDVDFKIREYFNLEYFPTLGETILFIDLHHYSQTHIADDYYYKFKREENVSISASDKFLPFFNLLETFENTSSQALLELIMDFFENLLLHDEKKKEGSFYTPRLLTFHTVVSTVLHYLNLQIDPFKFKHALEKYIKELSPSEVRSFLERLFFLRVLDPACGTGQFLETYTTVVLEILKIILQYHEKEVVRYLQEKTKDLQLVNVVTNKDIAFSVKLFLLKMYMVLPNIYGVDLNETAVALARIRLLLLSLPQYHSSIKSQISDSFKHIILQIYVGNALIGFQRIDEKNIMTSMTREVLNKGFYSHFIKNSALDIEYQDFLLWKPFHWFFEFPHIEFGAADPDADGFDLIIGNPPWVSSKKLPEQQKRFFRKTFKLIDQQYDMFVLFIERALNMLKKEGIIAFVVPNRFLTNPHYVSFRSYLLKHHLIKEIVDFGEIPLFKTVNMPFSVLTLQKSTNSADYIAVLFMTQSNDHLALQKRYYFDSTLFLKTKNYEIRIYFPPKMLQLIISMETNSIPFKTFFRNARGVEIGKKSPLIQNSPPYSNNSGWVPFLLGKFLYRYFITDEVYLKIGDPHVKYKTPELYVGKKLLIRKTGKNIEASIDYQDRYVIQVIYVFKEKTKEYSVEAILPILNSSLMNFYFLFKGTELRKKSFPHYRQKDILEMPLKQLSATTRKILEILCHYLLFLYTLRKDTTLHDSKKMYGNIAVWIQFFDNNLINALVFALYLSEEQISAPLPSCRSFDLILQYLFPINYVKWQDYYWKMKRGLLSAEERVKFFNLTKVNLENIKRSYDALKSNKKLIRLLDQIFSHKMVKQIFSTLKDVSFDA